MHLDTGAVAKHEDQPSGLDILGNQSRLPKVLAVDNHHTLLLSLRINIGFGIWVNFSRTGKVVWSPLTYPIQNRLETLEMSYLTLR